MKKNNEPSEKLQETARLLGVTPGYLRGGLNLPEAGELLGIAASTLRRRALEGKIGFQRDGRAWRFFWWHLRNYLQRREHNTQRGSEAGLNPTRQEGRSDVAEQAKELGLI